MSTPGTNPTTSSPTTAKAQPSATASYIMMAANRDTVTFGQHFELSPNTTTLPDSTVSTKSDPKVVTDINSIDQYLEASMNTTAGLLINSTGLPNTVPNIVSTKMNSILNVTTTTISSSSSTLISTLQNTSTNAPPAGKNDIVEPPVITPVLDTCSTYREYKARVSNNIDEEHHHPNHCCENMRVTLADYPRISGNFIKRRG